MSDTVIKVEGLGKQYNIGALHKLQQHDTLRDKIASGFKSAKKHIAHRKSTMLGAEKFWALRDVSFEVKQGEVLGIIGKNGAGKSTLLKMLCRVTSPTEGRATLKGRVGTLLEVGTGFHQELTGRENIYLSGAILGMNKDYIERKEDEIINFSGVEKFIDTPVKRYSSGMRVRLGFAVAAHLEPEILLIDEVLAVGDAAFQKKCFGKMENITKQGRTVLFVSHNLISIKHMCPRVLLLEEGRIICDDKPEKVISKYLQDTQDQTETGRVYSINYQVIEENCHNDFKITNVGLMSVNHSELNSFHTKDSLIIQIEYQASKQFTSQAFAVHINNRYHSRVIQLNTTPISGYHIDTLGKIGKIELLLKDIPLTAGRYFFDIGFVRERIGWIVKLEKVITLNIGLRDVYNSGMALDSKRGVLVVKHSWSHKICEPQNSY
ncbi:MAG: ATP-binding cassette domain-containing protein [Candidatus Aegiribacteria sp.]|nr:ATP-binding cassette domain-containing protein [Candidatus Aegiribacteria sp.]